MYQILNSKKIWVTPLLEGDKLHTFDMVPYVNVLDSTESVNSKQLIETFSFNWIGLMIYLHNLLEK